ncbi:MAG: oligopeptide/dipeptide ABC transporter ATP-binding protein [Methanomassiliicoccales archaeon]|jgi:oligopeptide/dipeptide ABC transporter ATP-binding protein
MSDDEILIEARGLKKYFPIKGGLLMKQRGAVKAIDGVDIIIKKGETIGLVGESGCGKTTTGRCLLLLTRPSQGNIYYKLPASVRPRMLELEELEKKEGGPLSKKRKGSKAKGGVGVPAVTMTSQQRLELEEMRKLYSLKKSHFKISKNKLDRLPADAKKRYAELEELEVQSEGKGRSRKGRQRAFVPVMTPEQRKELDEIRQLYALNRKKPEELRRLRREMQIVFQDPYSSLNPRMLIKDIVGEPLVVHGVARGDEVTRRAGILLEKVGLTREHLYRYSHEFSGGQRQRIGVARALALNPDMIVLDEPTSALDVSVQAQILNLMNDLQSEFGLTYLFISHDLSTIRYMCDRINVMYLGKVVESANKKDLFEKPMHPYTEALLSVIPVPDPDMKRQRIVLAGDVPSPANPPSGCRFHTRCRYRQDICETIEPPLLDKGTGHFVACHFR